LLSFVAIITSYGKICDTTIEHIVELFWILRYSIKFYVFMRLSLRIFHTYSDLSRHAVINLLPFLLITNEVIGV
jgi:hypothetical protein